jgi:ATP-dependent Clp protease adaptor protein ClpS
MTDLGSSEDSTWCVLILNDDDTPMEFVVNAIEQFFDMDRESAIRLMLCIHLPFDFGRSTRTSRNSSGPLIKRRFRLAFSLLSGVSAVKLSIVFDARSAKAKRWRSEGTDFGFTARPSSTRRRMDSDSVGLSG